MYVWHIIYKYIVYPNLADEDASEGAFLDGKALEWSHEVCDLSCDRGSFYHSEYSVVTETSRWEVSTLRHCCKSAFGSLPFAPHTPPTHGRKRLSLAFFVCHQLSWLLFRVLNAVCVCILCQTSRISLWCPVVVHCLLSNRLFRPVF